MAFHPVRMILYSFFFAWSVALMGLTAYRIHYTKAKSRPDILTTRQHFYTPIVVELLTVSILGTIFSLWMLFALFAKIGRGPLGTYAHELFWLTILFVMSLVGAGVVTSEFSNLRWCRFTRVCRVLEGIKALSWIFWGWTIFLIFAAIFNMLRNKHGVTGPVHGRRDTTGSYPEPHASADVHNHASADVHNHASADVHNSVPTPNMTQAPEYQQPVVV